MKPNYVGYIENILQFASQAYRYILWRLLGLYRKTVTFTTKQGTFTVLTKDEGVGGPMYVMKQYEYDFSIRALDLLINQGYVFSGKISMLDVGANIGFIGIGLIRAGLVQHAIAVEPELRNFRLLEKNVRQNGLEERIVCIQKAVSDRDSFLCMELSADNPGDHRIRTSMQGASPNRSPNLYNEDSRRTIEVHSLPLPALLGLPEVRQKDITKPAFMWIDVEGYEGYVFKGGGDVLESGLPTVTEVWPYGILRTDMGFDTFREIVADLWTHYWVDRNGYFIKYPTTVFNCYLEELGNEGKFGNVILTSDADRERLKSTKEFSR